MQSGSQFYGVPDIQQLMMERGGGPPRMFVLPPEMLVSQPMSKPRLHHYLQVPMDHHYHHQQLGLGDDSSALRERDPLTDEDGNGEGNRSWPTEETLALVRIRSELDFDFPDSNVKGTLWDDVSSYIKEQR